MNNNAMAANTVHYQYTTEISQMMFVFGEVQEPLEETCFLVEDIARNQVPCVSLFDSYAAIPFLCRLHPHSFINLLSSHANLRLSLANSSISRRFLGPKLSLAGCTDCPAQGLEIYNFRGFAFPDTA